MTGFGQIEMYVGDNGIPVVRFDGGAGFMTLTPVQKTLLLHTAGQLCSAVIDAIRHDNPDLSPEIDEMLKSKLVDHTVSRPN
jgi:hypothetical protein